MDRKEKISFGSLLVGILSLLLNIFVNRDKVFTSNSANWWEFLNIQIPISIWVLVVLLLSSATILWFNRPKKKKSKIEEIHVLIMKAIANNDLPERDQILNVLLKNKIEITKTRLEFYLSQLLDDEYIEVGFYGAYWLKDKGRAYLVKRGLE